MRYRLDADDADGKWAMDERRDIGVGVSEQGVQVCVYAERWIARLTFRVALLITVRGVLERVHRVVVLICLLSAGGFTLERLAGLVPSLLDFEGVCGLSVVDASAAVAYAKVWGGDVEGNVKIPGDGGAIVREEIRMS